MGGIIKFVSQIPLSFLQSGVELIFLPQLSELKNVAELTLLVRVMTCEISDIYISSHIL